jgi:hypothetical protein
MPPTIRSPVGPRTERGGADGGLWRALSAAAAAAAAAVFVVPVCVLALPLGLRRDGRETVPFEMMDGGRPETVPVPSTVGLEASGGLPFTLGVYSETWWSLYARCFGLYSVGLFLIDPSGVGTGLTPAWKKGCEARDGKLGECAIVMSVMGVWDGMMESAL